MKKNTILDLNDILFAQIEKLSDDDLRGQDLNEEVNRSRAMAAISKNIISNANLAFNVVKHRENFGDEEIPSLLVGNDPSRESMVKRKLGLDYKS